MQRSHLRTFAALAFTPPRQLRVGHPATRAGGHAGVRRNRTLRLERAAPGFHLLEQVVDSGTSAGGAHRLARGHSVEGRKGMIGPVGIVAALDFEQRLFGN